MAHPDIINKTARDVMNTECITVLETASIDEAIGIIVSQGIKRLPVLDVAGKFKGLVSRESLMRTGFGYDTTPPFTQHGNGCQ
jgi:CBS domain-containing protein